MAEDEEGPDDFIEKFRTHLGHVNEFVQLVLNSHLEIEGHLDEFIDRMFFHPEHLEDARLTLAKARGYPGPLSSCGVPACRSAHAGYLLIRFCRQPSAGAARRPYRA
jgi:hypothetical protein